MIIEVTKKELRLELENGFMRKYGISRTRARREYKEYIERDLKKPPTGYKIVTD